MTLTAAALVQEARDRLNNNSSVVLTSGKVSEAYNAATEMWAMDVKCFHRLHILDLVAGEQEIDWATALPDTFTLTRVTVRDGVTGTGATAQAVLNAAGGVGSIVPLTSGYGYPGSPQVLIGGGGGKGAAATSIVEDGGVVGFTITQAGQGYTSPPNVTITDMLGSLEREIPFIEYDALPIPFRDFSPAPPYVWSVRGMEKLILYPKPASTFTNALQVYGYDLPAYVTAPETDTTVLPFPRSHREGLVRAVMLKFIESNLENPVMAARFEFAMAGYSAEAERVARMDNSPTNRPCVVGAQSIRQTRDSRAHLVPPNYVRRRY